jgi:hypothetical protein
VGPRNVRMKRIEWGEGVLKFGIGIKERGQPATSPIVEELNLGHVETGWSVRVRNRMVRLPTSRITSTHVVIRV